MSDTTPQPLDPDNVEDVTGFDLAAWIDDAKVPQRSLTVYKRADLRAELDQLEREIQIAEAGESASNDAGVNALRAKWEQVAQKIADSAVTITCRAITDDAAKQARAGAKAENAKAKARAEWDESDYASEVEDQARDEAEIEDLDDDDTAALIRRRVVEARRQYIDNYFARAVGEHLLARLVVSPKMTVEHVRRLSEQIGTEQRDKLMQLPGKATGDLRPPTAPFSQPSSKGRRGGSSSKRSGQRGRGA